MPRSDHAELQFIPSSHPGTASSRESQRRANAHAARVAHGRVRRFRMVEYQASEKTKQPRERTASAGSRPKRSRPKRSDEAAAIASPLPIAETGDLILANPISALASTRTESFAFFARPFNPIESYLLDYYLQVVIPYQSVFCNRLWDKEEYRELMRGDWMRLVLARGYSLDALLLISCRHLAANNSLEPNGHQRYMELAVKYKLSCVKSLNETISDEVVNIISDATVATVVMLACDEFWIKEPSTAKRHLDGALQMVNHNGGPQTLGLNGFLEHVLYKFWGDVQHGNQALH
ncbi:unnamed protein product [Clonostachys rosea]|uniref:Transcription factor domain-containing protein n=1 Tax=Bionectria ochroleuca TaxID=29856 RepID=A0ABY6UIW1_BIOOC|nr:unnamed protein product [Clonostachys rosea]